MYSWETSKENIKPIKCGRSSNMLASATASRLSALAVQDKNLPCGITEILAKKSNDVELQKK